MGGERGQVAQKKGKSEEESTGKKDQDQVMPLRNHEGFWINMALGWTAFKMR